MTGEERLAERRRVDDMLEYRIKNGDPYLNGLVWAIGFVYRFASVSAILMFLAWLLGRALHDR
jgi:hypothetical protein